MSAVYKRGRARVNANLTPMIDVTFLLIVFFVLVSQIVKIENVELNLPKLESPASLKPGDESRAVINIKAGPEGTAESYHLGGRTYAPGPEGAEPLRQHVRSLYQATPGIGINLRADRSVQYQWIEPVMQAVMDAAREAGLDAARINLVVIPEEADGR